MNDADVQPSAKERITTPCPSWLAGGLKNIASDATEDWNLRMAVIEFMSKRGSLNEIRSSSFRHRLVDAGITIDGWHPLYRDAYDENCGADPTITFVSEDGYVLVQRGHNCQVVTFQGDHEAIVSRIRKSLSADAAGARKKRKQRGRVHLLRNVHGDLRFEPSEPVGLPLITNNYALDVLAAFRSCVDQLPAPHPTGRLAIFEGPPGTGKTHLLRGLAYEIRRHVSLVILSPEHVASIAGPEMVGHFLSFMHRQNSKKKRVVLLLEDADEILLPRGSDNMSALSSLLNITDGILGQILDLRIVATTNAPKQQIDQAFIRSGRLLTRCTVTPLDASRANDCYAHHTGRPGNFEKPISLADIYKKLHDDDPTFFSRMQSTEQNPDDEQDGEDDIDVGHDD